MSDEQKKSEPAGSDKLKDLSIKENFQILFGASRAFWLVNLVNFGDGIAYFGILNLLTLFIEGDVGFTDQQTGIAVSLFTGGVTLFMFGGGFVSDFFGVRRALSLSLVTLLAGRLLMVLSPDAGVATNATLWSGLFLMALATGVLQPALYAGVKEFTDPRTATIGYSILYAIMNLGIVAETAVSPFIRESSGISGVFWVMIGLTVVLLFANLSLFTKKVEDRDRVTEYAVEEKLAVKLTMMQKIKALPFMDARFIFFIFILLPVRTLFAHQFLTLPHYVIRCFPEAIGSRYEWFQGLNPLIIVIFVPLIAAFTRKASVVKMMIIGTTVSALTTFILVPGPALWTLITYVILFSFGEAIWSSRFLEWVADLAPAGKVGAYMGLAGIPWFLAKATTGFYSGHMIAHFIPADGPKDSGTMWMFYGFIACLSPIGLLIGRRWMEKQVKNK
ncbi:MFS transporter [bacterium]|nr:MFS transporter [bacterium]